MCNSDINNTQILDTTTGIWSRGDDLPRSRSAAGCELFELNGNFSEKHFFISIAKYLIPAPYFPKFIKNSYIYLGEMGILLAGGCDESCHEHLDDTLFYPFSTGVWQTLDAKVYHQNIHQISVYNFDASIPV